MTDGETPIRLIERLETVERFFWCAECGLQAKYVIPVNMRPHMVTCKGCELDGTLIGHSRPR